jgi:hypothetical protein
MPKCIDKIRQRGLKIFTKNCNFIQIHFMSDTKELKGRVKKYIDEADEQTLRMVHAMLESNQEAWYDSMDNKQKKSLPRSIKQPDNSELVPHEEVRKMIAI